MILLFSNFISSLYSNWLYLTCSVNARAGFKSGFGVLRNIPLIQDTYICSSYADADLGPLALCTISILCIPCPVSPQVTSLQSQLGSELGRVEGQLAAQQAAHTGRLEELGRGMELGHALRSGHVRRGGDFLDLGLVTSH